MAGDLGRDAVAQPNKVGDKRTHGRRVELLRSADLLDVARIHHGDPVGDGERLLLVVSDEQGRDAELRLDAADLIPKLHPHLRVERGQRLVEQQNARASDECTRKGNTLLLSAGELVGVTLAQVAEADHVECFGRAATAVVDIHFSHPQPELDVLQDGHVREERIRLEHHADVALIDWGVRDIFAVDQDAPGSHELKPGQRAKHRGLAAAGRAEECDELAGPHGQAHARERPVAGEILDDVDELDRRAFRADVVGLGVRGDGDGGDGGGADGAGHET